MASGEVKTPIKNGGTLDGTNIEHLMPATSYSVVCGMEVENWTRWPLEEPIIVPNSGSVYIPPRMVQPGHREAVVTHKTTGTATGSYGSMSWLIRVPSGERRVVVTWSAPFNFDHYSNYLAIGITQATETEHVRGWTKQMYNNDFVPGMLFVREEYYRQSREISIQDKDIIVYGGMGTSHKTRAYIHVKPKKPANYAPGIIP